MHASAAAPAAEHVSGGSGAVSSPDGLLSLGSGGETDGAASDGGGGGAASDGSVGGVQGSPTSSRDDFVLATRDEDTIASIVTGGYREQRAMRCAVSRTRTAGCQGWGQHRALGAGRGGHGGQRLAVALRGRMVLRDLGRGSPRAGGTVWRKVPAAGLRLQEWFRRAFQLAMRSLGLANRQAAARKWCLSCRFFPAGMAHGSVAIIRLSGSEAVPIASKVFRPGGRYRLDWAPTTHRIYYGTAVDSEEKLLDEVRQRLRTAVQSVRTHARHQPVDACLPSRWRWNRCRSNLLLQHAQARPWILCCTHVTCPDPSCGTLTHTLC